MGGAVKTATRVGLGAMTFGGSEVANQLLSKNGQGPLGKGLGNIMFGGGGGGPNAIMAGGSMSPMEMLSTTGGAPLLANIAMGASVDDTLASFLNIPKNELLDALDGRNSVLGTPEQAKSTIDQISSVRNQLLSIQSDTDAKNKVVNDLVQHFPDYMSTLIPKYKGIADDATQAAAEQALHSTMSKFAAGGQLSSGATAEALARTGADTASKNLEYGTNLAMQDYGTQLSYASALQSFQQKMLGMGATQGFNAVQNALAGNRQISMANAGFANNQRIADQGANNAMFGALGQLGGTAVGALVGGPVGAKVGGEVGSAATSTMSNSDNPRLNTNLA